MLKHRTKERMTPEQLRKAMEKVPPIFLPDNLPKVEHPQLIVVEMAEYRPCWVNGKKALFHRWANNARPQLPRGQEPGENARYFQFRSTKGLVEYEDGTVESVWPEMIQFADGGKFKDWAWLPMKDKEGE